MGSLIIHTVLAIVGIRLGLYCVMEWRFLRLRHAVASASPPGWPRFFLYALPVFAILMGAMVVNSALTVVRLLGDAPP